MITPSFGLTATERVLPKLALDFTTASLDARITFTRAGNTATRINTSGYVELINADLPRFDFNPITLTCTGLLVEESRLNLATYSADFSNTATAGSLRPWAWTRATVSLTSGSAPDNTNNANKLTEDATASATHQVTATFTVSMLESYTLSVFAKKDTRDFIALDIFDGTNHKTFFNLTTGQVGTVGSGTTATITAFKDGWYRCTVSRVVALVSVTTVINLASANNTTSYTGDGTSGLFIWGAQLEAGAFPTSYIPTVAATVTRNADVATMTGTNFSDWYSAGAGGIVARVLPSTVSGTRPALQLDDATANEVITLRGSTTNPELVIVDGGSPQAQIDAGTIAANTAYSLGAAWDTDNCAAAINGGAAVTDTSATIPTVTQARLGSDGTNYLNGNLQTLRYWPQRITNAEVRAFSK
jgi:hypothetical protein